METSYVRPAANKVWEHELEIKRSRFITLIARAGTEAEARAVIDAARTRFPDARHHCSAYIYHVDGANPVERSSDDGEPAGTAGKPMLEVLKGSGMLDVCAVVVRYFGGIKLGAGGLVRAYGGAVSEAMATVERVRREQRELFTVELDHGDAGRIDAELRAHGVAIVGASYAAAVQLTLAVALGGRSELEHFIASLTQAPAQLAEAGTTWLEI